MEALKWQERNLKRRRQRKKQLRKKQRRDRHLMILSYHKAIIAYALMAFLFCR